MDARQAALEAYPSKTLRPFGLSDALVSVKDPDATVKRAAFEAGWRRAVKHLYERALDPEVGIPFDDDVDVATVAAWIEEAGEAE